MAMIKSISGLRGEIGGPAGDGLTPLDIVKFTSAYATWVRRNNPDAKHIVVGRDARLSGELDRMSALRPEKLQENVSEMEREPGCVQILCSHDAALLPQVIEL